MDDSMKPCLVRRLMGRPGNNKKPMAIYMLSGEKYGPRPVTPSKKEKN